HGQPPKSPVFQLLAELPAIAEEPQVSAKANRLVFDDRQAVVTRGRRAGKDTLAHAIDERFLQPVSTKGKEEQAHAGSAVWRFVLGKLAFDAGLRVATDDRRGIARGCHTGGPRPLGR